nr:MAG TPA: hypothetical protein [Caudoviricetes sp.]
MIRFICFSVLQIYNRFFKYKNILRKNFIEFFY